MFKIYDIIINSEKIIKSDINILFITSQKDINNKYTSIEYNDEILQKYDKIIIINLFYYNLENKIQKYNKYLNHNGKLIFIEQFNLYDYDFISFFIKMLCKDTKLNEIYDILYNNELFIMDVDRLYSKDNYLSTTEYFSIICTF